MASRAVAISESIESSSALYFAAASRNSFFDSGLGGSLLDSWPLFASFAIL